MAYEATGIFRALDDNEERQFREYARENDPPGDNWEALHPVCREEWKKRGLKQADSGHKASWLVQV